MSLVEIALMLLNLIICNNIFEKLCYTLEEENPMNGNDDDEERKLSQIVIGYQTPSYIKVRAEQKCGCCQKSNRQESLFPCGKFGVSLMMFEFQFVLCLTILQLIGTCWYEMVDVHKYGHWAVYFLVILDIILALYTILYLMPVCTRRYMLVTDVLFAYYRLK